MRIMTCLATLLLATMGHAQTSLWAHISSTNGFGYRYIKSTSWNPANGGVLDLERTKTGYNKFYAIASVLPPSGTNYFNLSSYATVSADIKNTSSSAQEIVMAVVGDRQRGWDAVLTAKIAVPAGATQSFSCNLRTTFPDGTPRLDPNRVTSVQFIIDSVWGYNTPGPTIRVTNLVASGSAPTWVYPSTNGPRIELPVIENASPSAGHRVRYRLPGASNVYSVVYLPTDWVSGNKYPVIFELPGSICYQDYVYSDGLPDQCMIGYGMTKGQGAIWVSAPVVQCGPSGPLDICENVWGDRDYPEPNLTISNLLSTVSHVCANYGGDTNNLVLAGFSRGAIGCGFIGLNNPQIASLWKGTHACQQYDGDTSALYLSSTGYLARASNFVGRAFFQTDQYETPGVLRPAMVECMNVASNVRNASITYVNSGLGFHACANFLDDRPTTLALRSWFTNLVSTSTVTSNGTLVVSSSAYTVSEAAGSVAVTVRRTGGSAGAASVQYATGNGTATAGSDYTAASGTLSWASGDATDRTVNIAIANDTQIESGETFSVTLSNAAGAALGTPAAATVTIADNDAPATGVTVTSAEVWDGVANPHAADGVTLSGSGSTSDPAVYTVSNGLHLASGGSISCCPSTYDRSIRVNVRRGDLAMDAGSVINIARNSRSGVQNFILDLDATNSITGAGQILGLVDADDTPRALTITNVTHVSLANVDLHVENTAVNGSTRPLSVFAGGMVSVPGKIDNSDADIQGDGAGDVTVLAGGIAVSNVFAAVSRVGKTNGVITLKALAPASGYATNSTLNVLSNMLAVAGTLKNDGVAGSVGAGMTLQGVKVQFNAGSQLLRQSGATLLLNAGITNGTYTAAQLFVNNSGASLAAVHNVQWSGSALPGALAFSSSAYTVSEGGGSVTVTVKRTGGSAGAASAQYATSNGTAVSGSDYTATNGTLTWASGDASDRTVSIAIANDTLTESNETFSVTLSNASGATLGTPATATVTITDNDAPTTGVTVSGAEIWDGATNPHAADGVTLSGSGTVASPAVYTITNGLHLISSARIICTTNLSDRSIRFNIRKGNLVMDEGSVLNIARPNRGNGTLQTFTLDLDGTNSITGAGVITGGATSNNYPRALVVTNINNVALKDIDQHVIWANDASPRTNRSVSVTANGTVTVSGTVDTRDIDTGGDGASDIAILGGVIEVNNIVATSARASRPNGYITLKAMAASGGYATNSTLNQLPNKLTVNGTIQNDGVTGSYAGNITLQGVVVQFNSGFQLIKQSGATLLLNAGAILNGATANDLFKDDSGSSLTAVHNVLWSAGGTPGALAFSAPAYNVSESNGTVAIVVKRLGGSDGSASVQFMTGGGTATAGSDYTATNGVLNWISGDSSDKIVTVTISNDTVVDGGESVFLTLTNATGAVLGNIATATVVIADNDGALGSNGFKFLKPASFDSSTSAGNSGWLEIGTRTNGQNYGYSSTTNTGASAGEAGGAMKCGPNRSGYIDVWGSDYGRLTLNDPLVATGRVVVTGCSYSGTTASEQVVAAFLDSAQIVTNAATRKSMMALLVRKTADTFTWRMSLDFADGYNVDNALFVNVTPGQVVRFVMTWNPSGGANGVGQFVVSLYRDSDGTSLSTTFRDITASQRYDKGANFDAFGMCNFPATASDTWVTNYVDSLSYSALPSANGGMGTLFAPTIRIVPIRKATVIILR